MEPDSNDEYSDNKDAGISIFAHFTDLPSELQRMIFDFALSSNSGWEVRKKACSLSLVCKSFKENIWKSSTWEKLIKQAEEYVKAKRSDEITKELIEAAKSNNIERINFFISGGADLNKQDIHCNTALIYAADKDHTEIVNTLVQASADLNKQNKFCYTALILAAGRGHTTIVNILVQKHADLNKQNHFGNTALIRAAEEGHEEIVEILVQAQADLNLQNKYGDTALILAETRGHAKIVEILKAAEAKSNNL